MVLLDLATVGWTVVTQTGRGGDPRVFPRISGDQLPHAENNQVDRRTESGW